MLYKLVKWTRRIRILLGGSKWREDRFKLFQLSSFLVDDIRRRLIPLCFQYNAFSTTYKKQIWTVRELDPDGRHQYHLRFYSDGWCTGHWEIDPLISPGEHLASVDLRKLTKAETNKIEKALEGMVD